MKPLRYAVDVLPVAEARGLEPADNNHRSVCWGTQAQAWLFTTDKDAALAFLTDLGLSVGEVACPSIGTMRWILHGTRLVGSWGLPCDTDDRYRICLFYPLLMNVDDVLPIVDPYPRRAAGLPLEG